MKNLMFIISLGFLIFSCGNNSVSEDPKDLKEKSGNYTLVNLDGEDISAEGFILQLEAEKQRLSGKPGCNNFVVSYKIEDKQLEFQPPMSTKMYCQGEMQYEETFGEVLPQIRKVKISEEELIFLSEENKELLKLQKIKKSE